MLSLQSLASVFIPDIYVGNKLTIFILAFLVAQILRICWQFRRLEFYLWVRKIPLEKRMQPIPVFLPGEFHGQRNLAGTVHRVTKS